MSIFEKILIVRCPTGKSRRLCDLLRKEGYLVLEAADLTQAARFLPESPVLLLLDVDLAAQEGLESWATFVSHDCQAADIPCILFSSGSGTTDRMKEKVPWVAGTILRPEDDKEVVFKVASQLISDRPSQELCFLLDRLFGQKEEIKECQRAAAQIQQNLIPTHLPSVTSFRFAWRFEPCEEGGGDLFNVLQLDEDTIMAYVLDVSGHGISSSAITVVIYQSLSHHMGQVAKKYLETPPYYKIRSPAEVLGELERIFPFERFEKYFTISYLLLIPSSGRVYYSNAGHPPPILVRADGPVEFLRNGGAVIGLGKPVPFSEGEVVLHPGDRLYLYTDGITEYAGADEEFFDEERFCRKLLELKDEPLDSVCGKVIEAIYAFGNSRPPQDDVTLFGIEYLGH